MKTSRLFLVTSLLAFRLGAFGVTLPADEDSYGFRGKLSSVANKATALPVDSSHRAFVYFDIGNELPTNTRIRYARLRIYLPKVTRVGDGLAVHQVTGNWDESLASIEPTFTATPFTVFPTTRMGPKRFISVDVTSVVQSWIDAPATNEGFAITAIPGASAKLTGSVLIGAKEGAGSGYPAELEVEIASDPIANGTVGTSQIAVGAVQSQNIADGAVGISALADGSVTSPKIATGAVTDEKIVGVSAGKVSGMVANAAAVNGIGASVTPTPNMLLPLDAGGKVPSTVLPEIGSANLAPNLALAGVTTGTFSGDGAALTNVLASVPDGSVGVAKLDPSLSALISSILPRPLEFVPVGNPGNTADTAVMTTDSTTGYGSVSYAFQIGKYEVTNDQYSEFLNAVAATDPNGLYDASMGTGSNGGIVQDGASGSFIYSAMSRMRLRPVVYVNWLDAARFCNWLHNGKPVGAQGPSTTEDGAYTIIAGSVAGGRNQSARYFLPTENEWYKAAYFDPAKGGGPGYWMFPTRSNTAPTATAPNTTNPNSGNFFSQINEVTAVGGYVLSPSGYGTFDQGGNVFEWNETIVSGVMRGLRGGGWNDSSGILQATFRNQNAPTNSYSTVGFRVAKP